jgi:hypothetical protein
LPAELASQYLNATLTALETPDAGIPLKISAVRATRNFCGQLPDSLVIPLTPRIISNLGPLILVTTEDTLILVLDALNVVLELDHGSWLTPELTVPIATALLEIWVKNARDPILFSSLTDLIANLASAKAPGAYQTIASQALPNVIAALTQAQAQPKEGWLPSSAIEIVTNVVRGTPEGAIGENFFATLAPSLFGILRVTEDREVSVKAVECLTLIVQKDANQILSWTDPATGTSGLENVLNLIAKMLSPQEKEAGGLFMGDLIIHLLRKAGDAVVPVLPGLLQALVNRITTAEAATFLQSLIIPFAFLIHTQMDTVLNLLESTTTTTDPPRNGLEVLAKAWCENAETFIGFWPTRVSTLALCQLFLSNRPSLLHLQVKGDQIVRPETKNVIMTRSRAKKVPTEYTSVPFPVKALKIILHELQQSASGPRPKSPEPETPVDATSDDEDADWADEEDLFQGLKKEELGFLSEFLDEDNEDVDDLDDDELKNDPISKLDMRAHLLGFLRQCASHSDFQNLVQQLNPEEASLIVRALN